MTGNLRFTDNMALLAKVQATRGVAETVFTAKHALLLVEPARVVAEPIQIDRNLVRPYWGASEKIPATVLMKLTFKVELTMAKTAGAKPAIGALLRGCGFAETVFAGSRVEYDPISQETECLTFQFFQDGVQYTTRDARGRCKLMLNAYQVPVAEFEFWGCGRVPAEAALPSSDFTDYVEPLAITAANTSDVRLGVTLAAGGGLTGGTSFDSKGLEIDVANDLQHYLDTTREEVGIARRRITGKTSVLLTPADEIAWYSAIAAVDKSTFGFVHGAGNSQRIVVYGRRVQRADMDRGDDRGRVNFDTNLVFLPENGNDDIKLVFK